MRRHIEIYRDAAGQWRWRIKSWTGGHIVADGGEGYTRRREAIESVTRELRLPIPAADPDWPVVRKPVGPRLMVTIARGSGRKIEYAQWVYSDAEGRMAAFYELTEVTA